MFDAYHKWLGIPPADQPPNHYRLLGISLFEDDPTVIEMASDQRMGHLRTFQTSQESAIAERLLNEVTVAKLCLLRPQKKAPYDEALRATLAARAAPEPPPRSALMPPARPTPHVYPTAAPHPPQQRPPPPTAVPPTVLQQAPPQGFVAEQPNFVEEEPSVGEQQAPSPIFRPMPQPYSAQPQYSQQAAPPDYSAPQFPSAAARAEYTPAGDDESSYEDADPLAEYEAPRAKLFRRSNSKVPLFAILGPIAGVLAVGVAIMVFNANNASVDTAAVNTASNESKTPHKPVPEQVVKLTLPTPRPPLRPKPSTTPPQSDLSTSQFNRPTFAEPKLVNQFHPVNAVLSWFTETANDALPEFVDVAQLGSRWWSSLPKPDLARWMPGETTVPPMKLSFDQDDASAVVPVQVATGTRLQIMAWMDSIGPGRQLVLQEKPEPISVTFEVDHDKPGFAIVRAKPWLGNSVSGVPCSLKRLHAMADTLPGQLKNAQASFDSITSQIDSAERNLRSIAGQTHTDAVGKATQQVAIREAKTRISTLHARQNALARSGDRWTAQLKELPDLIKAVEGYVGKTVQYQIYYTVDKHEIVVASTAERAGGPPKSASSASFKP